MMSQPPRFLTSKELMSRLGISRATLNNYVAQGILPRPQVSKGRDDANANIRRIGHFPASVIETLERVKELKNGGYAMAEIVDMVRADTSADSVVETLDVQEVAAIAPSPAPSKAQTSPDQANGRTSLNLTIDQIDSPAYMVNGSFELEWVNDHALEMLFDAGSQQAQDITERKLFNMLFEAGKITGAEGIEELLRFHVAVAKRRISRSSLVDEEEFGGGDANAKALFKMFDEISADEAKAATQIEVNLAPRGEKERWYAVHVSYFREGIFFAYSMIDDGADSLIALLSRRDIVIRDLLKRRRPYLTDLAVMVADLQSSVKICSELPPDEYFQLINDLWTSMEPKLRKYYGTHGKHVGDGLVSYFFPQPDSNYILNALACAQEMKQAMVEVSRRWRGEKNWLNDLVLNIGIHEGQEWFGTFQTPTHIEFTVLGDTINMAARLSDLARDGSVWATKSLVGKLTSRERRRLDYGIRRYDSDGREMLISETFSRVSGLTDLNDPLNGKFNDIGMLAVTEVFALTED